MERPLSRDITYRGNLFAGFLTITMRQNPLGLVCFKSDRNVYNNECATSKLYRVVEDEPLNGRSKTTMQQTNSLNVTFVFSVESIV